MPTKAKSGRNLKVPTKALLFLWSWTRLRNTFDKPRGGGNGQFNSPSGLATDSTGDVYVTDGFNHRIQEFTSSGTYVNQWGTFGTGNGQFNYTRDITVAPSGNIYVIDFYNDRIQEFTSSGTYIAQWGAPGTGNGQFGNPDGITVGH